MKMLLPLVALVLISLVLVWPHLKPATNKFKIGIAALKTQFTKDANMINPRYVGTDKEKRPFSITADIAKNLSKTSGSVEMEMPKADITLADGSWLVVTAKEGVFNRDAKRLDLQGSVNLFHDSGYEFRTSKLNVDLESGMAVSKVPVQGQGPFGTLKSEGFRIIDRAQTIFFTGKTKMIIYPGVQGPPK
jgi:lipopolysaccharide export system protein LptC